MFIRGGNFQERKIVSNADEFTRKFCGCMSLRGGCAIACAIWIGFNTYIATLAFQGTTPVYSYLNRPALYVLGSLSIVFSIASFLVLYGLFVGTPNEVRGVILPLICIIFVYLIDNIVNIFLFGIQKSDYMKWCLNRSYNKLDEIITITPNNGTAYVENNLPEINIYNCQKLWEDELKFGLTIFLLMFFCYTYWAVCCIQYHEKRRMAFFPTERGIFNPNLMNVINRPPFAY